jgi:cupin fold WbuC family metalloprotein
MINPEIIRLSQLATKSCHDDLMAIDKILVEAKALDARRNRRKREVHVLHSGDEDTLQRMLNAIQPGSYIRPHRHQTPPKAESIVLLQGMLGYISFANDGTPQEDRCILLDLKRGLHAIDTRGGVWHTFFALEPDTVVFEVKPGPYTVSSDKEFAPWAPDEDSPVAVEYLMHLESLFRSTLKLAPGSWEDRR